jgi:hypothetical protein
MKTNTLLKFGALAFAALSLQVQAGPVTVSSKNAMPPPVVEEEYVGGRGLLTIEGPTGMFINPTSGTMPAGAFTAQYCFFLPNWSATDPLMAHGALLSFGVTDWLEVGGLFSAIDLDGVDTFYSGGPMVRVRLLKQDAGMIPELSIGGYAFLGDEEKYSAFLALFKSFEISKDGFLRSVGFHAGIRDRWIEKNLDGSPEASDDVVGYFGVEVELPLRFYLVGEVSTPDEDLGGDDVPYAFGIQWRLGGINVSVACLDNGFPFVDEPSFFFGIGTQFSF